MKQWLKRLTPIGIMLAIGICILPTIATYAAGTESHGNSSGNGAVTGGEVQSPGVIIGIRTIENTTKGQASAGNNEVGHAVVGQYLNKFTETVSKPSVVNNYALIIRYKDSMEGYRSRKNLFCYDADTYTGNSFSNIYETTRIQPQTTYVPFIYSQLKSNEKFKDETMTYDELKQIINSNRGSLNQSINSLVGMFSDTGQLNTLYREFMNRGGTNEDGGTKYLDMLIVVNEMCGGIYDNEVQEYLINRNKNGADRFIICEMISVISIRDSNYTTNYWYSYPSYMASMTGKSVWAFGHVDGQHANGVPYNSDIVNYKALDKAIDWNRYMGVTIDGKLSHYWEYIWYDTLVTRYDLMPGDLNGEKKGGSGYTFFTDNDIPKQPTVPTGEIYLDAMPDSSFIKKDTSVTADIKISLLQSNDNQTKITDVFKEQAALGIQPTLTITLSFQSVEGSGTSAAPYDICLTAGATLSGNKITIPNLTIEQFNEYMTGKKTIDLKDTDILITVPTNNKYGASAELKWTDSIKCTFTSTGKDPASKGTTTAFDYADWLVKTDINSYYSEMETPYVEIKHNSPDAEEFEAMAGVPTTEDLYAGFGATEFMLNVEVERKESSGSRKYTLTYTASQCIETDEMCVISSTSHSHSHQKGVDGEGNPIMVSFSWQCGESCGECGGSDCPGDQHNCGHATGTVGVGCQVQQKINNKHPHSHTWTGTVTQPINTFAYTDITGLELWQVNRLILDGNEDLFWDPYQELDPNTGYRSFFNQEGYSSGNGRLVFDYNLTSTQKYGDTNVSKTYATKTLKTDCDTLATEWMNSLVVGKTVTATVISDYVSLTTSEGYQVPMYYEYKSNTVPLTSGSFTTGSETKTLTGANITFASLPTWATMWTSNTQSAAQWEADHITRSGYNGKYSKPNAKWNNINQVQTVDPAAYLGSHPNSKNKTGSTSFNKNMNNQRLTIHDLDIIDSTDSHRNWSADDDVAPVSNGFWDTGNCYIEVDKEISFNTTGGVNYSNSGSMYREEVTYSPNHDKVNDIVIHNPVSTQYATVITNNAKYDQRTASSLAEGGDPVKEETGCPEDSSCEYSYLDCAITPAQHTASCYTTMTSSMTHVGGLNTHVHGSDCYSWISGGTITYYWMWSVGCSNHDGTTRTTTTNTTPTDISGCSGSNGWYVYNITGGNYITVTLPRTAKTTDGNSYYVTGGSKGNTVTLYSAKTYRLRLHSSGTYAGQYHVWDVMASTCLSCTTTNYTTQTAAINLDSWLCNNSLNTHVCTAACRQTTMNVLTCSDPHHYAAGQPWTYEDPNNHYDYGDSRCYKPCLDDTKHGTNGPVKLPDGSQSQPNDIFINIDREFTIYFPNKGDFEQSPNLHGIASCTKTRGMGYYDGMNTSKWLRDKYVTFPVNVIDANGDSHAAGTPIDLLSLPDNNGYYKFYCILANKEKVNATTEFLAIGNNAKEIKIYNESTGETNKTRTSYKSAPHTAAKYQIIDALGYIGALTINDTGDFRFATLFKQLSPDGGWLIENLVPRVNYKLPNKIVADNIDVRQEKASSSTIWHSPYQVTEATTGGKAYEHVSLPLAPYKNPIEALRKQPMRPGYQLYMDIETVGDYYGENVDENYNPVDSNLYYKMQITPRYWKLNLDTGAYTPVDVYMGTNGEYRPVVLFDSSNETSEWIYYLNWLEESARRNYTSKERTASNLVATEYSIKEEAQVIDGVTIPGYTRRIRLPLAQPDPIGTANRLFLNDLNRTFIGSSTTYGVNKNPDGFWDEVYFNRQSQRWHFTLGLPSSAVFVEAGQPCTDTNIKAMQDKNSVIICAIDIKVKGEVWTLEYNGTGVNTSDGSGFKVTENGSVYAPPIDPDTGKKLTDPIIVVYSNKYTSKNDLRTEGSH